MVSDRTGRVFGHPDTARQKFTSLPCDLICGSPIVRLGVYCARRLGHRLPFVEAFVYARHGVRGLFLWSKFGATIRLK